MYYFQLQFKRINRTFSEAGIPILPGYIFTLLIFTLFSSKLFENFLYAPFIYTGIWFILVLGLNKSNAILTYIYPKKASLLIRAVENLLVSLPFLLVLFIQKEYLSALILLFLFPFPVFIPYKVKPIRSIPTPFKNQPFEFTSGFRRFLFLVISSITLCLISIISDNFNLGIFSLALMHLTCICMYMLPENEYFVWIYSKNVSGFFITKNLNGILCSSILLAPVITLLMFFFFDKAIIISFVFLLGLLYLSTSIFAKYSAFPSKMSVPQAILFWLSTWFPFFLVVIIPVFYRKSKKQLSQLLQ